jgi:hypothetical protein
MDVVVPGSGVAFDPLVMAVAVLNRLNVKYLLIDLSAGLYDPFSFQFVARLMIST